MKKFLLILAFALPVGSANAQFYYQDSKNSEMLRHAVRQEASRKEIVLPVVNGYNVYKADLHTHTVFSDGSVLPKFRVKEAWLDGLDIMAVTEHIEYRPSEATLVDYLEKYTGKKHKEARNIRLTSKPADEHGIMVDLNYGVGEARKEAVKWGITIIPGSEITRSGSKVGHFNALFTTDNNLIYDPDPLVAIRNAKKQGALVMHNHPGWTRKSLDYTEVEKAAYDEGLIDGVEVMNGGEFYPKIVDRVRERGLFIAANSDIHGSTGIDYGPSDCTRPMTLIFAKDLSEASLREALTEDRTLAYGFNTVCGSEQLLKDFFKASVSLKLVREKDTYGNPGLMLTNNTSIPYLLVQEGKNPKHLAPFSTISIKAEEGQRVLKFTVLNMFCSEDGHPVMELPF